MLITNGRIITWNEPNEILTGMALLIQNGVIAEIAPQKEMLGKYPGEEVLDAHDQLVMPGNICAHTHFYGAFSRGMAIPGAAPSSFPEILDKLWWPLDRVLSLEDVKYSALVCMIDAIKHGTTTLIDHHASPNAIEGSLNSIADAAMLTGVRASLCYEVTDRNGADGANRGIQENVRFINRIIARDDFQGRLSASFGLHASLTVGQNTLEACRRELPDGFGFHIHVAEHSVDEYDSISRFGTRVIDRLEQVDGLDENTLIVHGVHLDVKEIASIAKNHSWVSHQPRSNMNNAVGLPVVDSMMRMGIPVCLGNDGFSNSMWDEWKTAYLVHKLWNRDPRWMNGYDVVQMGIYNNSKLATQMFKNSPPIGKITRGSAADLIFVDYFPFTEMIAGNLPWHILFGFNESMITMTMVAGKILMLNRQLLNLDEREISEKARYLSAQTWKRYQKEF